MKEGYSKRENYRYRITINQVVIVLEIWSRQVSEIYSTVNKASEYWENEILNSNKFKFLEPIKTLIYLGVNTRFIVLFKSYSHFNEEIRSLFQSELKTNFKVECEFATSSGDLWHLLSKNIQNFDIIHIFSCEPQRVPDSVLKYLQDNKATKNLKVLKTGSSMQDYSWVLAQISSKIISNLQKNERFIAKNLIRNLSKSSDIEAINEEVSKEDNSKSNFLHSFAQNLSDQI